MSEQKKAEEFGITEDDVSEIRQDINKFRFELVDILRKNNFDIGKVRNEGCYGGRRAKQMERRIMKVIWEKIDNKRPKVTSHNLPWYTTESGPAGVPVSAGGIKEIVNF